MTDQDPFNLLKTLAPMPVDVFGLSLLQRFIMLALANEEYQAAKSKDAYKMLSAHAHIAFFNRDEYLEEDYANTKASVSRALHRLEVRGVTQKKLGKWELTDLAREWVNLKP